MPRASSVTPYTVLRITANACSYCVGTRRRSILDAQQIKRCREILNSDHATNFETRMVAEVNLYWLIYSHCSKSTVDHHITLHWRRYLASRLHSSSSTTLRQRAGRWQHPNLRQQDLSTPRERHLLPRYPQVDRATKKLVWEYRDPHPMTFFTPFMGRAQKLKNGNTLITEAAFGRIFEITEEGKMCWEYMNEDFADYKGLDACEIEEYFDYPANAVFRAYEYTPEEIPWLQ